MLDVEKPGSVVKRDRVLSDSELAQVWSTAAELGWPFGMATQLLILTAARLNEIWQLRWDEIHGDEIRLVGARTKTGQPHIIPLSQAAQAILQAVPKFAGNDFVFAGRNWSGGKAAIVAKVKIAPWRTHDLRRTVATGLERLGTPLQVTEAILGHVSGSKSGVVGIYQRHSFAAEKREALEKWARHICDGSA
jgi:integrase